MTILPSLRATFAILALGVLPSILGAQNSMQAYKLGLYQDAARISYKGVITFDQQKADVPLSFRVGSDGMDLSTNASAKILYYRVRVDSVAKRMPVANWTDILRANISKRVTVVYQIGQEFDEVGGNVRYVNEEAGLILLQGSSGAEFFIPLDQIKQVHVSENGEFRYEKKVPVDVLEIALDSDLGSLPVEMHLLNSAVTWSPLCRLRILDSNKARLQMQALVENHLTDFLDVEIELNPGNLLAPNDGQSGEPIHGGKLSLKNGDRLILNLQDLEVDYESAYFCHMPWKGLQADGNQRPANLDNSLRLVLPPNSAVICDQYVVVDEHNRQVASLKGGHAGSDGSVQLSLGPADDVKVSLVETETLREAKAVKIGNVTYDKVTVEAKVVCQNTGQKFSQLQLSRDILGDIIDSGKATATPSANADSFGALKDQARTLTWKVSVDKGQTKEIAFRYTTLVQR